MNAGTLCPFPKPPTIETARLRLRPLRLDDAANVFAYASDPKVARYVPWPAHTSIEESRQFVTTIVEGTANPGWCRLGHRVRETGVIVGTCSLGWTPVDDRAELGYALGRAH